MADDKKPEKKRSPLYDAPKGEAKHGARAEKKPEPKKEGKEGSAKEEKTESKAEAKAEGDTPAKAAKPKEEAGTKPVNDKAGGEAPAPKTPGEMAMESVSAMAKRHEAERRDHHGNVREQHRQMDARHLKEMKDLHATHLAQLTAGNAPAPGAVPGNAPAAPQAQAAAAAPPAA